MKKVFYIIGGVIVLIIVIILMGSGGEKKKTAPKETPTYSINQDVRVADIRWKLIEVKDYGNTLKSSKSKYPDWYKDKTSLGKFIMITMEVENLGTEMKSVSNLKIIDDKGREFISASDVSAWIPEEKELFLLSNLNPNMPQEFTDIYEVPTDAKGLKIKVGDLSFWGTKEALIDLGI